MKNVAARLGIHSELEFPWFAARTSYNHSSASCPNTCGAGSGGQGRGGIGRPNNNGGDDGGNKEGESNNDERGRGLNIRLSPAFLIVLGFWMLHIIQGLSTTFSQLGQNELENEGGLEASPCLSSTAEALFSHTGSAAVAFLAMRRGRMIGLVGKLAASRQ